MKNATGTARVSFTTDLLHTGVRATNATIAIMIGKKK